MRENRVGEFRRRVGQKCEALGIELVAVPAKYTRGGLPAQRARPVTCVDTLTNHDQLGTHSICNQEFHADINAAFSNRFPCMGRQSVSSGGGTVPRPTGGVRARIMAISQSHVLSRNEVPCSQRLRVIAIDYIKN